jgi:hypothetical protein
VVWCGVVWCGVVCGVVCGVFCEKRKVRFRKDELMAKSIKQLRELLAVYALGTQGCVDKRDMVDRLIASGE